MTTWPPARPPVLPPGWRAELTVDRSCDEQVVMLRTRPWRRYLFAAAGLAGAALLWVWCAGLHRAGEERGWVIVMGLIATSATLGSLYALTWHQAWAVRPGRLYGGEIWLASGAWHGRPDDAVALTYRTTDIDDSIKVELIAVGRSGGETTIFADDRHAKVAREFAGWLSEVAGLPIR